MSTFTICIIIFLAILMLSSAIDKNNKLKKMQDEIDELKNSSYYDDY